MKNKTMSLSKKNRRFRKILIAALASGLFFLMAFAFIFSSYFGRASYKCRGCNVILISIDTLRADHMGYMGYGKNTSPNIDMLSQKSLVFENAISQATWTLPSHVSLFSSLYPDVHGVTKKENKISQSTRLLPEILKENGYLTRGYHEGGFLNPHFGFGRGFDVYTKQPIDDSIIDSIKFIEYNKDKKFFLFLHTYKVHSDYYYKEDGDFLFPDLFLLNIFTPSEKELNSMIDDYDRSIAYVDSLVGKLIEKIESEGLMDNTIIIVTSDHGEGFMEHGIIGHGYAPYQELVHIPLVFYLPGKNPERIEEYVELIDIMPTILDAIGIKANFIHGQNMLDRNYKKYAFSGSIDADASRSVINSANSMKLIYALREDRYIECDGLYFEEGKYLQEKWDLSDGDKVREWIKANFLKRGNARIYGNNPEDIGQTLIKKINNSLLEEECSRVSHVYYYEPELYNLSNDKYEQYALNNTKEAAHLKKIVRVLNVIAVIKQAINEDKASESISDDDLKQLVSLGYI